MLDSGLSLITARDFVQAAGASEVLTAVFARKPWPTPRGIEADFVAWDAPARYIIGYGKDKFVQSDIEAICQTDPQVYFAASVLWQIVASWVNDLKEY